MHPAGAAPSPERCGYGPGPATGGQQPPPPEPPAGVGKALRPGPELGRQRAGLRWGGPVPDAPRKREAAGRRLRVGQWLGQRHGGAGLGGGRGAEARGRAVAAVGQGEAAGALPGFFERCLSLLFLTAPVAEGAAGRAALRAGARCCAVPRSPSELPGPPCFVC